MYAWQCGDTAPSEGQATGDRRAAAVGQAGGRPCCPSQPYPPPARCLEAGEMCRSPPPARSGYSSSPASEGVAFLVLASTSRRLASIPHFPTSTSPPHYPPSHPPASFPAHSHHPVSIQRHPLHQHTQQPEYPASAPHRRHHHHHHHSTTQLPLVTYMPYHTPYLAPYPLHSATHISTSSTPWRPLVSTRPPSPSTGPPARTLPRPRSDSPRRHNGPAGDADEYGAIPERCVCHFRKGGHLHLHCCLPAPPPPSTYVHRLTLPSLFLGISIHSTPCLTHTHTHTQPQPPSPLPH
ncbi:hypothetical protein E2C01_032870 [Portunus trituberculatus]|uniref:Uncharacterized protein n=1 Tax=Portunus trituberculatus TaxID=210409 RepID=A0A5B7F1H7_PORTR|nr:hypothetical protein [Portunus trituberculatus]